MNFKFILLKNIFKKRFQSTKCMRILEYRSVIRYLHLDLKSHVTCTLKATFFKTYVASKVNMNINEESIYSILKSLIKPGLLFRKSITNLLDRRVKII